MAAGLCIWLLSERGRTRLSADADRVIEQYVEQQIYGAPDQCLEKLKAIEVVIGSFELNCFFTYASMDYDYCKQSIATFAEGVLPALKKWDNSAKVA